MKGKIEVIYSKTVSYKGYVYAECYIDDVYEEILNHNVYDKEIISDEDSMGNIMIDNYKIMK